MAPGNGIRLSHSGRQLGIRGEAAKPRHPGQVSPALAPAQNSGTTYSPRNRTALAQARDEAARAGLSGRRGCCLGRRLNG